MDWRIYLGLVFEFGWCWIVATAWLVPGWLLKVCILGAGNLSLWNFSQEGCDTWWNKKKKMCVKYPHICLHMYMNVL